MHDEIVLNPNKLVQYLDKPARDFTRKDIVKFIEENDVRNVNFRYVAGDGRLKTLNFVINSKKHLDHILATGERVDGSNLFSYIPASSSDLYVIPRYRTAFLNPFTDTPTVELLCSYYTSAGKPLESAPEYVISRAFQLLKERTGYELEMLGELEYYLISDIDTIYPIVEQKGYHESSPFSKWEAIRRETMQAISEMGGQIKYGHAEVGNIVQDDRAMVQHEIEFLPMPAPEAADHLVLAKWAIREITYNYGMEVSFAPKIIVGHAGSGLHIHCRLVKEGKNAMVDNEGLSDVARKLIAGFLTLAPSLTAFGNTVPTSFLRLVPHQEAPTSICWGDRNRSVLVRVPLGWVGVGNMAKSANPMEPADKGEYMNAQTVELRSPDGSANAHQLMAGLCVAALYGLEYPDALKIARDLYVSVDASTVKELRQLPASCYEAGEILLKDRDIYEKYGIFPAGMIEKLAQDLKAHNDKGMSEKLYGNEGALKEVVKKFFHCG